MILSKDKKQISHVEKMTFRMGENVFKAYIIQRFNIQRIQKSFTTQ